MTYPPDFETRIGFDWIRDRLSSYCLCELGVARVGQIAFQTSTSVIRSQLDSTRELVSIRASGETLPLHHCIDPTPWYQTIRVEDSFLEVDAIAAMAWGLESIEACAAYLKKHGSDYPVLAAESFPVQLPSRLTTGLLTKFDDKGNVRDSASPELSRIRKRLRESESNARRLVDRIFRELAGAELVPTQAQPVLREGRIAIPVRAENKRKVKGIILDESASGQTVFMEPAEVVEANNEIRDLQLEERREIIKILKDLTALLREHLPMIERAFEFMGLLDFVQAKARFAGEIDARLPLLINKPCLAWRNARHPLLLLSHNDRSQVVPLTIDLNEQDRFLLVSGPNAGGKSVCLKTVGLLQYMVQCGLLVPMDEDSQMGVFNGLFVDIGDQQSIENDLSTYSSHLRNMNYFVTHATSASMVLMDELGAGTDPNFGGGIAEAILETLVQRRVWGVATTHYYNLKLFANNTAGIRNGAMLFDSSNLRPLFQLEIDKPGSSFALEIAKKTGLPAHILQRAQQIIGEDLAGLEKLMKRVADEKILLQQRELALRKKEAEYQQWVTRYNNLVNELEQRKKEILSAAKSEAAALLHETNREIEKTIRHIKENRAERKETRKARENLKVLTGKVRPGEKHEVGSAEPIKVGDHVRLEGQERSGEVIAINGANAIVQFGEIRSTTKLARLTKSTAAEAQAYKPSRKEGIRLYERQSQFNTTLDVRGKRAEEAVQLVDQFIDNAMLLGHGELRILHGKGEGILRKMIREKLKQLSGVATFHDEHVERGGDGITVVVLK